MSNSLPENFQYLCFSIENSSNGLSIQESNSNQEKTNNQPFIKEELIIDPSTSQKTVSRPVFRENFDDSFRSRYQAVIDLDELCVIVKNFRLKISAYPLQYIFNILYMYYF